MTDIIFITLLLVFLILGICVLAYDNEKIRKEIEKIKKDIKIKESE